MLNVSCTTAEKVPITANPQTGSGQPAQLEGPLTVTVESGDGSVEQDPSTPLEFNAVSGSVAGDTVFLVQGDADLGAGVVTIEDRVTLTVTEESASAIGLVAGPPIPK
jgi:hypothetical protein